MIDLSINEINVHYLGHSEVIKIIQFLWFSFFNKFLLINFFPSISPHSWKLKFDYPYKAYEKNIRSLTGKYYHDQYEVFYQTPDLFLAFLEADFKQVSHIGNHKLNYQLEKIKLEAWLDFFKTWCVRQVERTDHKFIDNSWVINLIIELFIFLILTCAIKGITIWIR